MTTLTACGYYHGKRTPHTIHIIPLQMGFSGNSIMLLVLYSGGLMMQSSVITVGDLSAFLMYAAYVGISIGGLSNFYSNVNKSLGASTRLWEIIDRDSRIPNKGRSTWRAYVTWFKLYATSWVFGCRWNYPGYFAEEQWHCLFKFGFLVSDEAGLHGFSKPQYDRQSRTDHR